MNTATRARRRAAAVLLVLSAALVPAAAEAAAPSAPAASAAAAPGSCPVVKDPLYAAATRVDVKRITPDPDYRSDCRQLYRADTRSPEVIFEQGFQPRDPRTGEYDLNRYVLQNPPSPYVSTSYDHDLYKQWGAAYNYYVDAPGGIDVNETLGDDQPYANESEVAFPGGVDNEFIVAACPVDRQKRTEIMTECVDNPHYAPWRN